MANTQNYINHLLQNTGITPACSEEERLAAEDIAQIFRNHGFDPEVQEFNAPAPSRLWPHPWPQPPGTSSSRVRLPPFWDKPESASYSASRPMMGRPLP